MAYLQGLLCLKNRACITVKDKEVLLARVPCTKLTLHCGRQAVLRP